MATEIKGVFADDLHDKILKSKLLVVGAGGIGCEILKNLVMSGFKDIEIIDLDTIDVSNLNRQFLFHKEHVGKSKADVARESALSFNPNVEIKAYHDSITTTHYGVNFFQKFNLVLNALDNQAARNHVNRMCLTANVPLIESGTAGYNGQVELIQKGLTQCYECTPKAAQKSFPGCTIRNTPSEPIHCIVWAKHLFNQLFGEDNPDDDVSPDTADPEAAGDAGNEALAAESNEKGNVDRVNTKAWAQNCDFHPEKLFNKFFHDDILYLLSMSNLWKSRKAPNPLKYGELHVITGSGDSDHPPAATGVMRDQKVWDIEECTKVFDESLASLKERAAQATKLKADDHLVWDKDDKDAMDFVAACANIRAAIFSIPTKSRFEIKSMAGNIIPAIATTNAITAGIVVLHAFKVLQEKFDKCQSVYMRLRPNARNQLFVPDKNLNAPNPKCYVCASKPEVVLKVDTEQVTVKELRDEILKKNLNMVNPDVMLDGKGVIVISSEEDETECNEPKLLKELSIVDGCILKVDDFFQNYELTITVLHIHTKHDEPRFEIIADMDTIKPKEENKVEEPQPGTSGISNGSKSNGNSAAPAYESDDDDLVCIEMPSETNSRDVECTDDMETGQESPPASSAEKRKLGDSEEAPPLKKRAKIQEEQDDDDDVVCID